MDAFGAYAGYYQRAPDHLSTLRRSVSLDHTDKRTRRTT